jgi:hypothetical protein
MQVLGRILNRVTDLAKAQLAVMNPRARGDARRIELAEEHLSRGTMDAGPGALRTAMWTKRDVSGRSATAAGRHGGQ